LFIHGIPSSQAKTFMSRFPRTNGTTRATVTDKREAILRAAVKVFARKGYFNSKVADIASEAGIADGTVYLYFKSKDEVLRSVFDRTMEDFISEGRDQLSVIHAPQEKLRWLAHFHLRKLGADRNLAIVFQVELRGSTKFMEEFSEKGFRDYLDVIRRVIEEGQSRKEFRQDINPKTAAKIFYGALDEMVTNWILSKKSYPLEPFADEVLKVFLGGIGEK
jgi:TetR/AcrR family fatty acid metabolism transcriptional regulator